MMERSTHDSKDENSLVQLSVPPTEEKTPLLSSQPHNGDKQHQNRRLSGKYEGWTNNLRDIANSHNEIMLASMLLRDVINDGGLETTHRRVSVTTGGNDEYVADQVSLAFNKLSQICRIALSLRFVWSLTYTAVTVLVALSFVEHPDWCRGGEGCAQLFDMEGDVVTTTGSDDGITTTTVQYYPNFGMLLLNPTASARVEFWCLIVLAFHLLLVVGRSGGMELYFKSGSGVRNLRVMQFSFVIYLIFGVVLQAAFGFRRPFGIFVRILVWITFSKDVLRQIQLLFRIVPAIIPTLLLLFFTILFYGWFGVTAFNGTREGLSYFPNLIEAMWTLWICVTTANYPDVMMFAFNENRFVMIFFVSFMILTFYFLMNVILSIIANAYSEDVNSYEEELKVRREWELNKAFDLLDLKKTGSIDKQTVMTVFTVLNEDCPDIRYIPKQTAELLFAILDKDGDSSITKEEFMDFSQIMLLEFEMASSYSTMVELYFPNTFTSSWYQKLFHDVKSEKYEYIIDIILVLNAIVAFIQTLPELLGKTGTQDPLIADGEIDTVWELMETIFTTVYFFEALFKITILGWKRYHEDKRNTFDLIITVLSVASAIYVYYPNEFSDSRLIRWIVIARVLRLTRLFATVKSFKLIAATWVQILPAAKKTLLLLFCIMYIFAALGMALFGGKINRDPDNPLSDRLVGTEFAEGDYWANNFNDMMSGMNVLFNLLIVNNWTTQADGIVAVTGSKWYRFFFLVFHIIGVIVVNNIVVGLIIDNFLVEFSKTTGNKDGRKQIGADDEAVIYDDDKALFDASKVTGTSTELSGLYYARVKGMRTSKLLTDLFTKNSNSDHGSMA